MYHVWMPNMLTHKKNIKKLNMCQHDTKRSILNIRKKDKIKFWRKTKVTATQITDSQVIFSKIKSKNGQKESQKSSQSQRWQKKQAKTTKAMNGRSQSYDKSNVEKRTCKSRIVEEFTRCLYRKGGRTIRWLMSLLLKIRHYTPSTSETIRMDMDKHNTYR